MLYLSRRRLSWIVKGLLCALIPLLFVLVSHRYSVAMDPVEQTYKRSTYSSPIALSADNKLVWSVIPEQKRVSVIRTDTNQLIKTIDVGKDPESIALDPTNRFAYVANAADNNVTIIRINNPDPNQFAAAVDSQSGRNGRLTTGAEPFHIVISPDGKRLFVANSNQDTITVINAQNRQIIGNVDLRNSLCNVGDRNRHFQPQGLAVTQDNKQLYVTRFLSFTKPGGVQGNDLGREGVVYSVVWQFGTGPRRSVPLNGTFNPRNRNDQRILNYSAIFDEVQDFENNIRNVSGPGPLNLQGKPPAECSNPTAVATSPGNLDPNHGLLFGDNGNINQAPCEQNAFRTLANSNRQQHKIQLPGSNTQIKALDALNEWVRVAVRTPNGPLTTFELEAGNGRPEGGVNPAAIAAGRVLFNAADCQSCHVGGKWTRSTKDFASPPGAAEVSTETDLNGPNVAPNPNGAQYLPRFLKDIKSFNLNVPGSGNAIASQPLIGAVEKDTANNDALGLDYNNDGKGAGYNIPSLLGIHSSPPYYHNGACETLSCVVADVNHRKAGLAPGKPDPLTSPAAQALLVTFLESIDQGTTPP